MFGHRYFGARYFGPRYFGGGGFNAPVLTWDGETTDLTPDFLVDFGSGVLADDVLRLQIDDNASFTSPDEFTNTLDDAEILAGAISMGLSALSGGTYYVRLRIERDPVVSDWSNVETITLIDSNGGLFGHSYFGARYFGPRYFGPQGTESATPALR